jgi:hypothetical protein
VAAVSRGRPARQERGSTSNERPPVHHSITWSARASSDGGIVRPSAFAVCTGVNNNHQPWHGPAGPAAVTPGAGPSNEDH